MTNYEKAKGCVDKEVRNWNKTSLTDIEVYIQLKYIIWGIMELAMYILNFEDYNKLKQYIYDEYGYNVGGVAEEKEQLIITIKNGIPHETVTEFADRCRECGKQKTGHWIEIAQYSDGNHKIECSECKSHIFDRGHANSFNVKNKYKYCPNCGARMVEPQESKDLGDYPDTIPNQFDNMTGGMNI